MIGGKPRRKKVPVKLRLYSDLHSECKGYIDLLEKHKVLKAIPAVNSVGAFLHCFMFAQET